MKRILFSALLLSVVLPGCIYIFLPRQTPILMYHSIGSEEDMGTLDVTTENFLKQMKFIAEHNYKVISLDEYADAALEGEVIPAKSVVITFDDGYENNYINAFPILKERGFPATIFVISNFVGRAGYLSWEQIGEMIKNGISIGVHTANNAYLPDLTVEKIRAELSESKQAIERNTGDTVTLLCYPTGGYTQDAIDIARDLGFKAACTTNRGRGDNIYAIRRIKMTNGSANPIVLRAKLSGFYNMFRKYKAPN